MRDYHKNMDKRMFDFEDFYREMAEKIPYAGVAAEVGLASGSSAVFLAEALLNQGKFFRLLLVDNLAYGGPDQLQEILHHVCEANIGKWLEIVPFDSLVASCRYPDEHFDFVFIDSSHKFEATKAEIRCWFQKIKCGGILAGHDYLLEQEVQLAVNQVVPHNLLNVEGTSKNCGVWWLERTKDAKLN